MQTVAQVGSLAVVTNTLDKRQVDRELRSLSPTLFLDPEIHDRAEGIVWTVKEHVGSAHPPVTVLVWRGPDGRPLPLSGALVEQVKRQEKRSRSDELQPRRMAARNHAIRDRLQEQAEENQEHVLRTNRKRLSAAYAPLLPPRRFGAGRE